MLALKRITPFPYGIALAALILLAWRNGSLFDWGIAIVGLLVLVFSRF